MMKEIDISTRECSHIVADIALPEDIYYTFKKDMLVKYYNNEISFDLVEFLTSSLFQNHEKNTLKSSYIRGSNFKVG